MAKNIIKKATGTAIKPSGKPSMPPPWSPASKAVKQAAQSMPPIPKGGMASVPMPGKAGTQPKTMKQAFPAKVNAGNGGAKNWGKGIGNADSFPPGVDQSPGGIDSGPKGPMLLKTSEKTNMKRGDLR